jgi:WD40 repeat protein
VLLTLTGHQNLIWNATYSPDGQHIATASRDGVAILWNANTGKTEHTLVGHTSAVISVAYNPDGSWLATGSLDGSIKIWDTATGQEVLNLSSGTGAVLAVDFSPDGRYLAATGRDKTVRVYAMQVEDLVRLSLARLTRWWTPEECQKFLLTEQCPPRP